MFNDTSCNKIIDEEYTINQIPKKGEHLSARNVWLLDQQKEAYGLKYGTNPQLIITLKNDKIKLKLLASNLPLHFVAARIKIYELDPEVVSLWEVINSFSHYEMEYFRLAEGNSEQAVLLPKLQYNQCYFSGPQTSEYLEPGLIDVYREYETFILLPSSEEERKIPFLFLSKTKPWRPNATQDRVYYSIPDENTFLERFSIFTANQFDQWDGWENMLIVGGAVCNCLLLVPKAYQANVGHYYHDVAYKTSDIDIYFYGLSCTQFTNKLIQLYGYLCRKNPGKSVLVFKTPHTFTFVTGYPQRHIQVVLGKWDTKEQILLEPDIDCSCFGFDGKKVWATQRARFSMNHRVIVASSARYHVRGFPEYESRLVKYSKRGFMIWDKKLKWEKISDHYLQHALIRLNEHQTVQGRTGVCGLRLLVILHKYKHFLNSTDIMTVLSGDTVPGDNLLDNGIPYGKEWPNEKVESAFLQGLLKSTCSYGVVTLRPSSSVVQMRLYRDIQESSAKTVFRKELVKLQYENNPTIETKWYSHLFHKDYIQEIRENRHLHSLFYPAPGTPERRRTFEQIVLGNKN